MTDVLTPKKRSALNRALKNKELLPLLYRKINGLYWFDVFKKEGLLEPECNPKPIHNKEENTFQIPSWSITEYLVSSSAVLKDPDNIDYAIKYLELLRETTKYAHDKGYGNYRTWWQFSKIIRNLPAEILNVDDVYMAQYWISDQFERGIIGDTIGAWLLELLGTASDNAVIISSALLKVIFQIDYVDKKTGSYERTEAILLFNSYNLDKLTKNISHKAGEVLKKEIVAFFLVTLEGMLDKLQYDDFSYVKRSAIEDHDQNHNHEEADDVIINCLRESLLGYIESSPGEAEMYLRELFDSHYQIVNRICIFTVDKEFLSLSDGTISKALINKYFNDNYRHETWSLLANHFRDLSDPLKQTVYSIINNITEYDDNGIKSEIYTAYNKLIWLSAIKEDDDSAAKLYSELLEIAKTEPKHPEFCSYSSTGVIVHKSPIELKELRLLSYDDLVSTLNDFQGNGGFTEPSIEGLTKTFFELVKTDALVIYKNLDKFSRLSIPYAYSLISAFFELWTEKEKSSLDWEKVWSYLLNYIHTYVQEDKFWEPTDNRNDGSFIANKDWIIGTIGRLLESGCKSDEHSFGVNHIDKSKMILILLLSKTSGENFSVDSDAVSVAINSPRGKCLEAIIDLALYSCRHHEELGATHNEIWESYLSIFNEELSKADTKNEYEFATLVTQYLHNFLYLSKEWTLKNLPIIFDKSNYQRWLCAIQGYSYVNRLHQDVYNYLKNNGDFIKILDDENLKDRVDDRYIQFITLEYISGIDGIGIKNSQLILLIERAKLRELSQVIWFIWTLRDHSDEKLQSKVYEIWSKLLELVDDTDNGRRLASKLCHLVAYITSLDNERLQWLLRIAPYSELEHNSHDLLELIARLSDKYPFEMHEVWLLMLTQYSYDYPDEEIKRALFNFVKHGPRGIKAAKEIAGAYLKHGLDRPTEWLTEIINDNKDKIDNSIREK